MKTKRIVSLFLALILVFQLSGSSLAYAEDLMLDPTPTENTVPADSDDQEPAADNPDPPEPQGGPEEPPAPEDPPVEDVEGVTDDDKEPEDSKEIEVPDDEAVVPESSLINTEAQVDIPDIEIMDAKTIRAMYPADTSKIDIKSAFQYQTLSSIASAELYATGNTEFPLHSDSVKYNSWLYGYRICNNFIDGEYEQRYNWNVAFVSWCADRADLVTTNRFPKTADASCMYSWFLEHKASIHSKAELLSSASNAVPEQSDLLFLPVENDYWVGIITGYRSGSIEFIQGDVDCTVVKTRVALSSLPDDAFIIKWQRANDYMLPYFNYLCREVGLNPVAAVGVLANFQYESGFNPHCLGDGGTSYGLCQWHNGRWTDLIVTCEAAGLDYTTAEGQMYFLKQELKKYSYMVSQMNAQPNSRYGAYNAAYIFCYQFERPADLEGASERRGIYAEKNLFQALLG